MIGACPPVFCNGGRDSLTSPETVTAFAERTGAELTVMPDGGIGFIRSVNCSFLTAGSHHGSINKRLPPCAAQDKTEEKLK